MDVSKASGIQESVEIDVPVTTTAYISSSGEGRPPRT
jgi:hypothetical protein